MTLPKHGFDIRARPAVFMGARVIDGSLFHLVLDAFADAYSFQLFEREKAAIDGGDSVTASCTPEVLELLRAPGLVDACNRLVGRNWAVVPFTHNAPFVSGGRTQHWHKDDNSPLNGRRQRHHQAVQVEMLYFPQAVSLEMGPTATVPYSQYWAHNHEENQDNFSGADHIDFDYNILGLERTMVSGPDSDYDLENTVPVPARRGDVVVFCIHTIHGSRINQSDRIRRMVRILSLIHI